MKTMAEVLAEHQWYDATTDNEDPAIGCTGCPEWFGSEYALDDGTFPAHQAAALSTAGFGPVRETQAPEVRYVELTNGETELDEVVARDAYVHLEAMDDNHWWLLVTSGGKSVHVNFYTKRAKISGHAEFDE